MMMAAGDRFFFQLPSAEIRTVDHPLGSPSPWINMKEIWIILLGVEFVWIHGNICEYMRIYMNLEGLCGFSGRGSVLGSMAVRAVWQCGSARGCARHYVGQCAATCGRINMNWDELICYYMRAYELRWMKMNPNEFIRVNLNLDYLKLFEFMWIYIKWISMDLSEWWPTYERNLNHFVVCWICMNSCEYLWILANLYEFRRIVRQCEAVRQCAAMRAAVCVWQFAR